MSAREMLADIAAVHRCAPDDRSGWMRSRCIRIADALGASPGNSSSFSASKRGWCDRDLSNIVKVEYHGVLRAAAMVSDSFPADERLHILTLLLNETAAHESLRSNFAFPISQSLLKSILSKGMHGNSEF
jgi:hypothetical protein